jgi:hypothetical protein
MDMEVVTPQQVTVLKAGQMEEVLSVVRNLEVKIAQEDQRYVYCIFCQSSC